MFSLMVASARRPRVTCKFLLTQEGSAARSFAKKQAKAAAADAKPAMTPDHQQNQSKSGTNKVRVSGKVASSWQQPTGGSLSQKRLNQRTQQLLEQKAEEQDRPAGPQARGLLDKLKLTNLDEVTKTRAPLAVSLTLFGGSLSILALSGITMALSGYYTPSHTNSFSMMAQTVVNGLLVLGCGGLTGLRYVNFSVMPSVAKNMTSAKTGLVSRVINSNLFYVCVPYALFFASLTMVDSMVLYGVAPALLGIGMLGTCAYVQTHQLLVPLWLTRQIFRYLALGFTVFIFLGYTTVRRDMNMNETRQVMSNIQTQLDIDKLKYSKTAIASQNEAHKRRREEINKLKDPFL